RYREDDEECRAADGRPGLSRRIRVEARGHASPCPDPQDDAEDRERRIARDLVRDDVAAAEDAATTDERLDERADEPGGADRGEPEAHERRRVQLEPGPDVDPALIAGGERLAAHRAEVEPPCAGKRDRAEERQDDRRGAVLARATRDGGDRLAHALPQLVQRAGR